MNLCQVNLKTPGGEDNTMEVDMYKEQALVTWVNVIVQSKDTEIRIHGLEDVLEKRCLSILNSLLQIPFLQQESEEMNPLKELFQYVDGFYKNAISSQKLVDFELLQTTRRTKELRVEWCKFLLLLLAAAVQDRGREAFVTPTTCLASFLQVNIKDMLEVIINADQVPADFAAILFKSSIPFPGGDLKDSSSAFSAETSKSGRQAAIMPGKRRSKTPMPSTPKRLRKKDLTETSSQVKVAAPAARTSPKKASPERVQPEEPLLPAACSSSAKKASPERVQPEEPLLPAASSSSAKKASPERVQPEEPLLPAACSSSAKKVSPERVQPEEPLMPAASSSSPKKASPERVQPEEPLLPAASSSSAKKASPERVQPGEPLMPAASCSSPKKASPERVQPEEPLMPAASSSSPKKASPERVQPEEHLTPAASCSSPKKVSPERVQPEEPLMPAASSSSPKKASPERVQPEEPLMPAASSSSPKKASPERVQPEEPFMPAASSSSPKKASPERVQSEEPLMPAASSSHPPGDGQTPTILPLPRNLNEKRHLKVRLVPVSCFGVSTRDIPGSDEDGK